jgi:small subunit ribosomal protein S6
MPANLTEAEQKAVEEKVSGWIGDAGGEVNNSSHWGRRRLAYPIGPNREGYYILLEAQLEPASVNDFQRKMNIEPNVIRYLVVRLDEE